MIRVVCVCAWMWEAELGVGVVGIGNSGGWAVESEAAVAEQGLGTVMGFPCCLCGVF